MGKAQDKENRIPCTFCKKDVIHNSDLTEAGTHVGNSSNLAQVLMEFKYDKKPQRNHPLSMAKGQGACAQAHHLICSETMNNDEWATICSNFGYNINCKENGVFLPADMRIACQLNIPLHRGNHSATETGEDMNYVEAVKNSIKPVKDLAQEGDYCTADQEILSNLNEISKSIWNKVENFIWTLTYDGRDYFPGSKGCLGELGLRKKRESTLTACPQHRIHGLSINPSDYFLEQK